MWRVLTNSLTSLFDLDYDLTSWSLLKWATFDVRRCLPPSNIYMVLRWLIFLLHLGLNIEKSHGGIIIYEGTKLSANGISISLLYHICSWIQIFWCHHIILKIRTLTLVSDKNAIIKSFNLPACNCPERTSLAAILLVKLKAINIINL